MKESFVKSEGQELLGFREYAHNIEDILLTFPKGEAEMERVKLSLKAKEEEKAKVESDLKARMEEVDLRQKRLIYGHDVLESNLLEARAAAPNASTVTLENIAELGELITQENDAIKDVRSSMQWRAYKRQDRKLVLNDLGLFAGVIAGALGFDKALSWGAESGAFPTSMPMFFLYLTICASIVYALGKFRPSKFLELINVSDRKSAYMPTIHFITLTLFLSGLYWPLNGDLYGDVAPVLARLGAYLLGFVAVLLTLWCLTAIPQFVSFCWGVRPSWRRR